MHKCPKGKSKARALKLLELKVKQSIIFISETYDLQNQTAQLPPKLVKTFKALKKKTIKQKLT